MTPKKFTRGEVIKIDKEKPIEITMFTRDYYSKNSKFKPRKCDHCKKMITNGEDWDTQDVNLPYWIYGVHYITLNLHIKCKKEIFPDEGFSFKIK